MLDSASYFGFSVSRDAVTRHLEKVTADLQPRSGAHRVRILLHKDGRLETNCSPLSPLPPRPLRVCVSRIHTDSRDPFLFHKTTNRELYDSELQKARKLGFFDVLFLNEKGELTEGAITNVFVEKNGRLYPPPVECGLLCGTCRRSLMESGPRVLERVMYVKDLQDADAVYVSNALRGLIGVKLEYHKDTEENE